MMLLQLQFLIGKDTIDGCKLVGLGSFDRLEREEFHHIINSREDQK